MKAEDIKSSIEPIYVELLGRDGFEELDVRAGYDHAQEPALFISARIHGVVNETLDKKIEQLRERIFGLLRENEEERFPYLWLSYDEPEGQSSDDRGHRRRAS